MIYKKKHVYSGCVDYRKKIQDIDNALAELFDVLDSKVLESGTQGYKMNTGQSQVEVTLSTRNDVFYMIEKLEKLKRMYVVMDTRNGIGPGVTILRDQNNFR